MTDEPQDRMPMRRLLEQLLEIGLASDFEHVLERSADVAQASTGASIVGAAIVEGDEVTRVVGRGVDLDAVSGLAQRDRDATDPAAASAPPNVWVRRNGALAGGTAPALVASLRCGPELSGLLYVEKPDGDFSDDDEFALTALSRHAAAWIGALRLIQDKELEAERRTTERFGSLVRHSSDVTVLLDGVWEMRFVSPSSERILGYDSSDLEGRGWIDFVHPDDQDVVAAALDLALDGSTKETVECRLKHGDGYWVHAESVINRWEGEPAASFLVVNSRDVSERRALEDELAHQTLHDPLTDLPNRDLFKDRLEHALSRGERNDRALALLVIDLDDFKKINDSEGHGAGDKLLTAFSQRLRENLRGPDTAARLGGDEFALLLEDIRKTEDAEIVADRLLESMKVPLELDGREVFVRASIGIAIGSPREHEAEDLLRNADVAMHAAKSRGKGARAVFEPSMHTSIVERVGLEADLRRAVANHELRVYFQPTVSVATGRIVGMEALVRWMHPTRGLISPAEFIPLAEETGEIVPMGKQILEEACMRVREWQRAWPHDPPLTVSVNLSAKQLAHAELVDEVKAALALSGLPAESLVLEITETLLLENTEKVIATLAALKDLGVRVAIDDFGTGYSSLSYLQRLPIDILKIDRSFIAGLSTGSQEWAVARAIIELGQSLNLQTLAEGIELPDQLDHLRTLQCELCQGFYFARPLDDVTMARLLERAAADGGWPHGEYGFIPADPGAVPGAVAG